MLVAEILEETQLPYEKVQFNHPPSSTYAIYLEEINRRGSDKKNFITEHFVRIEIYAYDFYDDQAIETLDHALNNRGINYVRYEPYFINAEKLYVTVYEFSYITKDKANKDFFDLLR